MQKHFEDLLRELRTIEKSWVFIGVVTLFCSIALFAFGYNPALSGHLDYSWQLSLHEFFATKKEFGKDIVFTYGPYGFLLTKIYHPKTYWLTNLCWTLFALAFWWSSISIGYKLIKNKFFIFIWFFSLLFVFFDNISLDNFFTSFFIFWLLINLHSGDRLSFFTSILLSVTTALISLSKFSFFIIALPILGAITICDLWKKHKPIQSIIFIVTFFALWLVAGQSLTTIPSFIKNGLEIAVYYNEAMAPLYVVPSVKLAAIVCFFILSFLTILLVNWNKEKIYNTLFTFAFVFLIFITIKAGYSRFGAFTTPLHCKSLCVVAMSYFIICFEKNLHYYIKAIALTTFILMLSIYQNHLSFFLQINLFSNVTSNIEFLLSNVRNFSLVVTGKSNIKQKYEEEMAGLRQIYPLPELKGSVDMYSYLQLAIFAHNLNYKPRPVFQSYTAYSPLLAEINLNHLRNNPPDNIVFNNLAIEKRFPTLDDNTSWPEFLTKYEVKNLSSGGNLLILEHSKNPRNYSFVSENILDVNFGQEIKVPKMDLGPVWVKIQIQYSSLGAIFSTIHKSAPIFLRGTVKNGEKITYTLPISMAKTGFLLSPLIRNNPDFAKLASENWKTDLKDLEIESISIVLDDNNFLWQFSPKIKVTFSNLEFPRQNASEIASILNQVSLNQASPNITELINLSLQQIQTGDNNQAIINCEKVLELKANSDLAYNNMGIALLNLSLVDEAVEAFENAIKINPNLQLAINNLNYARSIKINSIDKNKKVINYTNLSVSYINAGKLEKSIVLIEKAIELAPNNPTLYNNLSVAYNGLKHWDKAIVAAEQAIKLAPDFQLAKNNLEWAKSEKAKENNTKK
ncbi:MAG: hypothetical protein HY819_24125 [Acidobacteria bacterium]|nr:hypothetical protein [Acidobacteriota bacterium]